MRRRPPLHLVVSRLYMTDGGDDSGGILGSLVGGVLTELGELRRLQRFRGRGRLVHIVDGELRVQVRVFLPYYYTQERLPPWWERRPTATISSVIFGIRSAATAGELARHAKVHLCLQSATVTETDRPVDLDQCCVEVLVNHEVISELENQIHMHMTICGQAVGKSGL